MDLEFHIGARVVCQDGPAGRLRRVVLNQVTDAVTSLVVDTQPFFGSLVLVDRQLVAAASHDRIDLRCQRAELRTMPEFEGVIYPRPEEPHPTLHYLPGQYVFDRLDDLVRPLGAPPLPVPALDRRLATGELALSPGLPVVATDGPFGSVEELSIDQDSGRLVTLVVRRGRLFGAHTVVVPAPAVESVHAGTIRLRMASAELEQRFRSDRPASATTAESDGEERQERP